MPQGSIQIKETAAADVAGNYMNFAANTAGTLVKTGPGTLLGININTVGTGGANIITLYDGLSTAGTILGVFSTTVQGTTTLTPIIFNIGLFVVLTGTTLSGNHTVVYL